MKNLNWYGWFNPWSGYGKSNLEWSTALERKFGGVSLGWQRQTKDSDPEVWKDLTEEQKKLILKPFRKERIGIIESTPNFFFNNISQYRIGFTMVENTKIGSNWVKLCNEMDHLFVPNKESVEIFRACGITKPVSYVRHGFNVEQYPYYERRENRSVFTFGIAGWLDVRKNWEDIVRAFSSEFVSNEPVRLILKNNNPGFGYMMPKDPRIKVIDRTFSPEEMTRFYQILDCLVFPTRGEGSGLPAREAMATGLPVILTNWLGLAEVAKPELSYPIEPVAIDFPDIRPEQPGFMARIDIREIMYWMRYVYEHQEEARQKGKKASQWMHKDWTWDACVCDMMKILEKI